MDIGSSFENNGYESEVTVYKCENCTSCPHKGKCTCAKENECLHISKSFLEKHQESYEKILSKKGILYRINRSVQVEGEFGILKNDYEFQRFLLRGKRKVKLEIFFLCMGYNNLNKLHAKIQSQRTASHLFPVKKCITGRKISSFIKVHKKSRKNQQTKRFFLDFYVYRARALLNHLIR